MALMHVLVRGCSPRGSNACFQRQPLNICASMPNGNDSSIHVQSMSCSSTFVMSLMLNPRYIQKRISPPRISENATFNMSFVAFLMSIDFFAYCFNGMGLLHCKFNKNYSNIAPYAVILKPLCRQIKKYRCSVGALSGRQRVTDGLQKFFKPSFILTSVNKEWGKNVFYGKLFAHTAD